MSLTHIVRETPIARTPRVQQIEGIFELEASDISREEWEVDLPLEEKDWNVGLIVGPSGSGKSTIAGEIFGDSLKESFEWEKGKALVDSFPDHLSIKDISYALSSVGFGSPPNWLRPYDVLSTGEKFRANLARCLTTEGMVAMDEFTSVVDRVVAQIGSHAMAKAVRRRGERFVGVSCHYDIIEWLQPDWTYEPSDNKFTWRSVRRRPDVQIAIKRVHRSAWRMFSKYHYLNSSINKSAKCFAVFIESKPVAFVAVIAFPHAVSSGWRLHRTVCLPDYQGLGIGTMLHDRVSAIMRATGKPVYDRMSHPAVIRALAKSSDWKMTSKPKRQIPLGRTSSKQTLSPALARNRITAAFKYVGKIDYENAEALGVI
tara:strand:- start:756 stop:1871 length:1116 start_codon:yes stop_codon:yes gene_type:complete